MHAHIHTHTEREREIIEIEAVLLSYDSVLRALLSKESIKIISDFPDVKGPALGCGNWFD